MSLESPRVALLVETSREFGRQLIRGISTYSHTRGPWAFLITPGDFRQAAPRMKDWGGDGIIARVSDRRLAQQISDLDLPTIVIGLDDWPLGEASRPSRLGRIDGDSDAVAEMAAEHLLDNRLKNFAFVGLAGVGFSEDRERAFGNYLSRLGYSVTNYPAPTSTRGKHWEHEHQRMATWIQSLPKPVGVLACNDDRGREVLDACVLAEARVPEDVSVIGVDNDVMFCDLASPPLSSVEFNAEAAGYAAASLLDRMMRDGAAGESIVVKPLQVAPRRSTNAIAVDDRDVAAALALIRTAQGRGVTVEDVVEQTALPRRSLEIRFRKETGRSILEEIQHSKLSRAKQLLATSSHPISVVAELSGYSSTSYLSQVFRRVFGCTPASYRRSFGKHGPEFE